MARASGLTVLSKLGRLVGLLVILGVLAPGFLLPYVGGLANYRNRCDEVAANDYEGFVRTG